MIQLPSVTVAFKETAVASIQRGTRGIVALIVKEEGLADLQHTTLYDITDTPELTEKNKSLVMDAFRGYTTTPLLVELIAMPSEGDIHHSLNALESIRFDYVVCPSATEDEKIVIDLWVKSIRNTGVMIKSVLAHMPSDHESNINVTQEGIVRGDVVMTAEEFTARAAGLVAGTDLSISCTYAPLPDVDSIPVEQKAVTSQKIARGEFVLVKELGRINVARGVNSLISTNQNKGVSFQKIKIVDIMDMINNDIRETLIRNYIGKYANSYDNKILLISAISGYLDMLVIDGLIQNGHSTTIDLERQKAYLKGKGVNVNTMSDAEIKEANTGDQVFLRIDLKILDAIENITINAYI